MGLGGSKGKTKPVTHESIHYEGKTNIEWMPKVLITFLIQFSLVVKYSVAMLLTHGLLVRIPVVWTKPTVSVVAVRASGWCAIVHLPSNSLFLLMIGSAANEVTTVLASLGRAFSVRFSLSWFYLNFLYIEARNASILLGFINKVGLWR